MNHKPLNHRRPAFMANHFHDDGETERPGERPSGLRRKALATGAAVQGTAATGEPDVDVAMGQY